MAPSQLLPILRKAQVLIGDSQRWSKRYFAEDKEGRWVAVGSERAVRFSLAGALIKNAGLVARDATRALDDLLARVGIDSCLLSSNGFQHSQALELLELAIRHLELSVSPSERPRP